MVTGLDRAYFCSFDGLDGNYFTIDRDQAYIDRLTEVGMDFAAYLEGDEPPPLSEDDHVPIQLDRHDAMIAKEYLDITREIKRLEAREKEIKAYLTSLTDDGNAVYIDDLGVKLLKATRVERVGATNWKQLCADKNISDEDIAKYQGEQIGYYRISKA